MCCWSEHPSDIPITSLIVGHFLSLGFNQVIKYAARATPSCPSEQLKSGSSVTLPSSMNLVWLGVIFHLLWSNTFRIHIYSPCFYWQILAKSHLFSRWAGCSFRGTACTHPSEALCSLTLVTGLAAIESVVVLSVPSQGTYLPLARLSQDWSSKTPQGRLITGKKGSEWFRV